jgi:hypothetical protein
MAHFVNAGGSRISNSIQQARMGASVTIGVWGAAGLSVGPNDRSIASIRNLGADKNNNTWFELTPLKTGYVMVEAKYGTSVWDFFQLAISQVAAPSTPAFPVPNSKGKYTDNPHEVPELQTIVTARQIVDYVTKNWSIGGVGPRVLAAQCFHETGEGLSCYNWNVGNVIAGTDVPHMYRKKTPNCATPSQKETELKAGLAHVPAAAETRIKCPAGTSPLIFHAPHVYTRFRAYDSLTEGGRHWLGLHRGYANRDPRYWTALEQGDVGTVAAILKQKRYYQGDELTYAQRMRELLVLVNQRVR